jgi:chromate reductase
VIHKDPVRVLAISGSLRRASSNGALVGAVARLASGNVDVSIYRELASLPPFNPDLEEETTPDAVGRFRAALQACGELIDKPVALINTSARATHAWESLARTLLAMSARVLLDASITVPLGGRTPDAESIAADKDLAAPLRCAIAVLAAEAREARVA